jgi:hypothetical protein
MAQIKMSKSDNKNEVSNSQIPLLGVGDIRWLKLQQEGLGRIITPRHLE